MSVVAYPKALTQAHWDKKKPLIAKTKPTGIGKALANLEKLHSGVDWNKFKPDWGKTEMGIASLQKATEFRQQICDTEIDAIIKAAKAVATLATTWEGKFSKEKLIPAAAAKAAKEVADAATKFAKDLKDVEADLVTESADAKKFMLDNLRSALLPLLKKNIVKTDALLSDIAKFGSKASKENFDALVLGDGGARGYCTALKNWDQLMVNFPEVRDAVFKGKAMDTFFKPLQAYGSGASSSDWEKRLDQLCIDKGLVLEDAYEFHANYLKQQVPEIKKFRAILVKAESMLK